MTRTRTLATKPFWGSPGYMPSDVLNTNGGSMCFTCIFSWQPSSSRVPDLGFFCSSWVPFTAMDGCFTQRRRVDCHSGLPSKRPGVVPGGSIKRQSYGSPMECLGYIQSQIPMPTVEEMRGSLGSPDLSWLRLCCNRRVVQRPRF